MIMVCSERRTTQRVRDSTSSWWSGQHHTTSHRTGAALTLDMVHQPERRRERADERDEDRELHTHTRMQRNRGAKGMAAATRRQRHDAQHLRLSATHTCFGWPLSSVMPHPGFLEQNVIFTKRNKNLATHPVSDGRPANRSAASSAMAAGTHHLQHGRHTMALSAQSHNEQRRGRRTSTTGRWRRRQS
jgi:hypothetical protein